MNLSDLVTRARSLSGIRLSTMRSDEQVEQVVNESYQEILSLYPWPFLRGDETVAMSAGDETFETPEVFRFLTSVVAQMDGETYRLKQTTIDELDRHEDEEGDPRFYARVTDREVRVWPAPRVAATVLLRGQLEYATLSGNDSPVFAEQFHPIVAYRAAARMLSEEGDDSGRAESYQLESGGYLQRMEKFYMASGNIGIIRIGSQRRGR